MNSKSEMPPTVPYVPRSFTSEELLRAINEERAECIKLIESIPCRFTDGQSCAVCRVKDILKSRIQAAMPEEAK